MNFVDFLAFAGHWQEEDCGIVNGWCDGADFTYDGDVDTEDMAEFAENWLKSAIMTYGFAE